LSPFTARLPARKTPSSKVRVAAVRVGLPVKVSMAPSPG
jgi:hypothetical protein